MKHLVPRRYGADVDDTDLPAGTADAERDNLTAFLDRERDLVLAGLEGLDDEQARATPTASTLCALGIVRHLAWVELWWFVHCLRGEPVDFPWTSDDPDADFRPDPDDTVVSIADFYRSCCERARVAVAAVGSLDVVAVHRHGRDCSMRWILTHMIEETAQHAGHLDIIAESARAPGGRP